MYAGRNEHGMVNRRMKNKGLIRVQTKDQVEEAVRVETPVLASSNAG